MGESDIVVPLGEEVELDLQTVDIGIADKQEVLAFTIEGVLRGLDSDLLETVAGTELVPTEIHFRIESQ